MPEWKDETPRSGDVVEVGCGDPTETDDEATVEALEGECDWLKNDDTEGATDLPGVVKLGVTIET